MFWKQMFWRCGVPSCLLIRALLHVFSLESPRLVSSFTVLAPGGLFVPSWCGGNSWPFVMEISALPHVFPPETTSRWDIHRLASLWIFQRSDLFSKRHLLSLTECLLVLFIYFFSFFHSFHRVFWGFSSCPWERTFLWFSLKPFHKNLHKTTGMKGFW